MKPSLWRIWLLSGSVTVGVMVLGGAVAGPFGFAIMAMGALFLSVPLAIVAGGTSLLSKRGTRRSDLTSLVAGWLAALLAGAGIAAAIAALPGNATSDLTPFLTWLLLLLPFALLGAGIAISACLRRWRRFTKGTRSGA
ncbi:MULTISPECIES: hypothetical protein [unclassified Microbacterium]|uniref:hypothetical protein n=1 Tax=unclassified Microbacterium TaxID=2609290 RepID=UPI0011C35654|nr:MULTISPECIES: hypothetical protein [unclassified Microbacterium]MBT2483826.1 hypothetical protein [Microbacterium sp. ISL-108]